MKQLFLLLLLLVARVSSYGQTTHHTFDWSEPTLTVTAQPSDTSVDYIALEDLIDDLDTAFDPSRSPDHPIRNGGVQVTSTNGEVRYNPINGNFIIPVGGTVTVHFRSTIPNVRYSFNRLSPDEDDFSTNPIYTFTASSRAPVTRVIPYGIRAQGGSLAGYLGFVTQ